MPNFDSIGANEYIMDVTHDVVDFISTVDTPFVHELNIWYHTLNCGFRTRVSGETDFPCMSDDRVGDGRSYVHLPQALTYDAWCDGVRDGRSYVSDGFSHLMNFTVNGVEAGNQRQRVATRSAGHRASDRAGRVLACREAERTPLPRTARGSHSGLRNTPVSPGRARSPSRWSSTAARARVNG